MIKTARTTSSAPTLITYGIGRAAGVSLKQIQRYAADVWRELGEVDSDASRNAARFRIDVSSVSRDIKDEVDLRPTPPAFAFNPNDVVLTIVKSGAAARVALDLWRYVLLPRIRAKWGDDALKERERARKDSAKKAAATRSKTRKAKKKRAPR
jgi:hypothetical protein